MEIKTLHWLLSGHVSTVLSRNLRWWKNITYFQRSDSGSDYTTSSCGASWQKHFKAQHGAQKHFVIPTNRTQHQHLLKIFCSFIRPELVHHYLYTTFMWQTLLINWHLHTYTSHMLKVICGSVNLSLAEEHFRMYVQYVSTNLDLSNLCEKNKQTLN